MPAFAGLRGTGSWGNDERPKHFREYILWADPNGTAPLTALMAKMKKEKVDDPEFSWWEETQGIVRLSINYGTGYSSTSTTLTVSSGGLNLVAGDILLLEKAESTAYDNEHLVVSSVTSDTVIVVKRGQSGTTPTDISDGAYLTKIGNSFQEGSAPPGISLRNPTKLYNYTQIFKTAVGITRTASQTHARTGDPWKNDKKRKAFDHATALETAWLFGVRYEDTTGEFPERRTGGLRQFITTNVKVYNTTPTEDDFLDTIHRVFDYNANGAGNERIAFCGNGFLNSLNKLARNSSSTRINFDGVIKLYGMELQRWITPQGVFAFRTHPLLNTHGRFKYSAFFVNPAGIVYRPLLDTTFKDDIQLPGYDMKKGLWITEAGIEVHHEKTMAYIGNFVV